MKIIVLGAGQVGSTVATALARERNEVTLVDTDPAKLRDVQDRSDLRGIVGNASHPDVLARAGAEDADLLIAVTNADEVNLIACQVAYRLFRTPTKIARVRNQQYLDFPQLFTGEDRYVDVLISPERLVVDHVSQLMEHPGALQVLDFAGGRAQLVAVRALSDGPLVGHRLLELRNHMPAGVDARVAAIYRGNRPIIPEGDTRVEVGDLVFLLAPKRDIRVAISELRKLEGPARRIIIAGGGNIGMNLAQALESRYYVKVIER